MRTWIRGCRAPIFALFRTQLRKPWHCSSCSSHVSFRVRNSFVSRGDAKRQTPEEGEQPKADHLLAAMISSDGRFGISPCPFIVIMSKMSIAFEPSNYEKPAVKFRSLRSRMLL